MTVAEHRRSPRYAADWSARYRLDADALWRDSRVIDVSMEGAAVELFNTGGDESFDGRFYLEIASVAPDHVGIALRAWIRRSVRLDNGRVIVGIDFAHLRPEEANLLHLLVGLRTSI